MTISTQWFLEGSVCEMTPQKHGDDRGFLSETFTVQSLEELKIFDTFVQDNHSYSKEKYTFRG